MRPLDTPIKLAALWLFILLNIIFRDLHEFVMPGFIETILTGQFNGMEITSELMLIGGLVVSVPISMVPLSLLLERRFARPLTFVAALITTATMIPPAPIDLDDAYHLILQLIAMAAIVAIAWRWTGANGRRGAARLTPQPRMDISMTDTNTPLTHEQNQPELFGHLGQTHTLMANYGLDHTLSVLIELRASQINQCAYCVGMHLSQARKAGVAQAKLDTLVVWREVDHFSPAEQAVLAWTEALTYLDRDMDLSGLRRDLREHYSDKEISVITADISMINLWNRVQKSKH